MTPESVKETVENDMVWLLQMDDTGDKVQRAIEYIDKSASARPAEVVRQAKDRV